MKNINDVIKKKQRAERIIQFGEGGFLRGFVDWMLQKLNDSGEFDGSVVIVQPIQKGMCDLLMSQNCIYTHVMRGTDNGKVVVKKEVIDVISRCVNPYKDYDEYKNLAKNKNFRFVVSNTTEAGINFDENDSMDMPKTFPAKLTVLLYERFKTGFDGFVFLPCELIEKNGEKLKECILKCCKLWNLNDDFVKWVEEKNYFCNTLVDRIVTGHPKNESIPLDYIDEMVNTSELFHLWVIEGDKKFSNELPFDKIGLNVIWTNDLEKYRTRKVRILNGAHTSMVAYALLSGLKTVKDCMEDEKMSKFVHKCIFEEIIPTLDLPKEELESYANSVLERFENPYIEHYLSSISLNSVSKFKVRVLPSILEYKNRFNKYPANLITSFAYLIKFYKTDMANDDKSIMDFMKNADLKEILSNKDLWDTDLSCLYDEINNIE